MSASTLGTRMTAFAPSPPRQPSPRTTTLGTLRFFQQAGAPFADLLMNALKPALGSVAVTKYLGASVLWSLAAGLFTVAGLFCFSVLMGFLVVRYHVYQNAIRADWKNNPLASKQINLLRRIARRLKDVEQAVREPKMIVIS